MLCQKLRFITPCDWEKPQSVAIGRSAWIGASVRQGLSLFERLRPESAKRKLEELISTIRGIAQFTVL